jgi:hypothetical protein
MIKMNALTVTSLAHCEKGCAILVYVFESLLVSDNPKKELKRCKVGRFLVPDSISHGYIGRTNDGGGMQEDWSCGAKGEVACIETFVINVIGIHPYMSELEGINSLTKNGGRAIPKHLQGSVKVSV